MWVSLNFAVASYSTFSLNSLWTLDPLQFAYRPNRSTDDAISHVLHSSLTHINSNNGKYVRLLYIDYSSACFNTIVPIKLAFKLTDLCLNSSLLNLRIQDFLTCRPQVVKVGQFTFKLHDPERKSLIGMCPESPALLSLHTRLRVLSQLHFYC